MACRTDFATRDSCTPAWFEEIGAPQRAPDFELLRLSVFLPEPQRPPILEELAAVKAYRFTFICTPLKFVGATGSPVRPLALVPEVP